jgi:hypothetical protein
LSELEVFEVIGGVLYYKGKSMDFIENSADKAINALEDSAVGSFIVGSADALLENISLGLIQNEAGTEHPKSYAAGRIIGDLSSEVVGFSEVIAGSAIEGIGVGIGVGLDATGIGAIEGVGLNIAGAVVIGHAGSVMYNGASNLGKDTSDLVQSFKGGSSEGIKKVENGEQFTKVDGRKALKPNVEYTTSEGHTYTTDSKGRISNAEAKLEIGEDNRNPYAQRTVGGEDRLPTDNGEHLIANIFKGSGELDNLVPMDSTLNKSEYKSLENTWKKALEEGKTMEVTIEPIYKGDSIRPSEFKIDYTIDGKKRRINLTNSSN